MIVALLRGCARSGIYHNHVSQKQAGEILAAVRQNVLDDPFAPSETTCATLWKVVEGLGEVCPSHQPTPERFRSARQPKVPTKLQAPEGPSTAYPPSPTQLFMAY
jgi:hypothetical protein